MQKPCTIKSKAESSKLLLKSWALCYPWKASKYSGIRALHLWHMLHPSKQTRTVFVPLFKLKKKSTTQPVSQAVITSARALSFSINPALLRLWRASVLLPCALIFLFYAPGPALIISALPAQFWAMQEHPFLPKSSFVTTLKQCVHPHGLERQTKIHSQCTYATVTTFGQTTVFLLLECWVWQFCISLSAMHSKVTLPAMRSCFSGLPLVKRIFNNNMKSDQLLFHNK